MFGLTDQLKTSRNEDPGNSEYPVEVGQVVYVQIISQTSIEGYSMQAGDPSYWNDPTLSSEEWRNPARPAIVIDSSFDKPSSLYKIRVVSLGRGTPANNTINLAVSALPPSPVLEGDAIVPEPSWPMSDVYCYAFPRATWFYCLPGQV